jgi:hypothetical protein
MANIRKQFNFRNGVQVDDDNLVVSPTGLVGIGTTVPTELLHVNGGNARITGFLTASQLRGQTLSVFDTATIENIEVGNTLIGAGISIQSGFITATDPSGIVTYYGDARFLQGMPTSQWLDIDVGLGFTSIYNRGFVGVATDDPRFTLQVAGGISTEAFNHGVGIHSSGDIYATGIITAYSYTGIGSELALLNADNIGLGTISNDRLPILLNSKLPNDISVGGTITSGSGFFGNITGDVTGNVTGNVTGDVIGNVTGIATGAEGLVGTPDIIVGILTASAVAASSFIGGITGDVTGTATTARSLTSDAAVDIGDLTVGIATVSNILSATLIGVGTDSELTSDITIRKFNSPSILQLSSGINTTTTLESLVSLGSTTSLAENSGGIRYNNPNTAFSYSLYESLDLINFGNGNVNYYLQAGTAGVGTGDFHWHHTGSNNLMTLTYGGSLGIGKTDPTARLEVTGLTSTSDLFVQTSVEVGGNIAVDGDISVPGTGSSITTRAIYIEDGSAGLLNPDGTEIIPAPGQNFNSFNITGVSTVGDLFVDGRLSIDDDHLTGGGLSINPITYTEAPFAAVQIGHPLDQFTGDQLGIGGTIDQTSVSDITLLDGGQVGIGTTALDEFTALTVYGTAVIERLAIGVGVTQMTTGALNIQGPIFVSEGVLDDSATDGTPSADIRTTGIMTALNGFSSGIGTGIKMNVVGNEIQFVVPGVGATSLTLF